MEKETAEVAWESFMRARLAHEGHDNSRQGSPITRAILEDQHKKFHEIFGRIKSEMIKAAQ